MDVGWIQHDWSNPDGDCTVAAINRVLGHKVKDDLPGRIAGPLHESLMARNATYRGHFLNMRKKSGNRSPRMRDVFYTWNDLSTTTLEDVLEALRGVGIDAKAARQAAKAQRRSATTDGYDLDAEIRELLASEAAAAMPAMTTSEPKELITV
jgi:hypothetical protein